MAEQFGRIMPGDLIMARDMNRILEELDALKRRVSTLEAGGPGGTGVVITELIPDSVRQLSKLRVVGRNFGLPEDNVVTIANVQVTQFQPGSDDTQLIFNIPILSVIIPPEEESQEVTLTVRNPQGFASTSLTLLR